MPMYNYLCEENGQFEKIKKISEREVALCPQCDVECPLSVSVPKMVKGGYMDRSMKFSQK